MQIRIRIHNTDSHFKFLEITTWGRLAPEILLGEAPCNAINGTYIAIATYLTARLSGQPCWQFTSTFKLMANLGREEVQ
jgi:hypothetical protein